MNAQYCNFFALSDLTVFVRQMHYFQIYKNLIVNLVQQEKGARKM